MQLKIMYAQHTAELLCPLEELVAPIVEALITIGCLLAVCTAGVFHPVEKKVSVLLQKEELSKDDKGLQGKNRTVSVFSSWQLSEEQRSQQLVKFKVNPPAFKIKGIMMRTARSRLASNCHNHKRDASQGA